MQNHHTNISNQLTLALHSTDNTFGFAYRKTSDFDSENIFIKTGGMEKRGGNLTFDAEELIKNYLGEDEKKVFEENPFLKFHSDLDLA